MRDYTHTDKPYMIERTTVVYANNCEKFKKAKILGWCEHARYRTIIDAMNAIKDIRLNEKKYSVWVCTNDCIDNNIMYFTSSYRIAHKYYDKK